MSARCLQQAVEEHAGRWRERLYGPLTTLGLFTDVNPEPSACQFGIKLRFRLDLYRLRDVGDKRDRPLDGRRRWRSW